MIHDTVLNLDKKSFTELTKSARHIRDICFSYPSPKKIFRKENPPLFAILLSENGGGQKKTITQPKTMSTNLLIFSIPSIKDGEIYPFKGLKPLKGCTTMFY